MQAVQNHPALYLNLGIWCANAYIPEMQILKRGVNPARARCSVTWAINDSCLSKAGRLRCLFTKSCNHEFGSSPASLQPPDGIRPCLGFGYATSQHARIDIGTGINKPRATLNTCKRPVFEVFFHRFGIGVAAQN